ncbi:MAG: hypothetical protein K2K93_06465 [Muribaculaceae bacterium]|nr:hypothetical protein [Muribaculaceae bacterium]
MSTTLFKIRLPDICSNDNASELLTANGLNEYDFGARRYYSAVPAFTSIDPLCENFRHLSPYLYCANNCATAVQHAMFETDISVAEQKYTITQVPANRSIGEESFTIKRPNFHIFSSSAYKSIIKQNPNGKLIKRRNK